jgi:hypothetical protein
MTNDDGLRGGGTLTGKDPESQHAEPGRPGQQPGPPPGQPRGMRGLMELSGRSRGTVPAAARPKKQAAMKVAGCIVGGLW